MTKVTALWFHLNIMSIRLFRYTLLHSPFHIHSCFCVFETNCSNRLVSEVFFIRSCETSPINLLFTPQLSSPPFHLSLLPDSFFISLLIPYSMMLSCLFQPGCSWALASLSFIFILSLSVILFFSSPSCVTHTPKSKKVFCNIQDSFITSPLAFISEAPPLV